MKYNNVKSVNIVKSRWQIVIEIEPEEGEAISLIASADHGVTYGDGIFLGTREEYDEATSW